MRTKKQSTNLTPLWESNEPTYPTLPEEYSARFDSGYRASLEPAIRAARKFGTEDEAPDLVHFAICDLLARWTRPIDPAPFPRNDGHFRGTLISCIRSRALDAKKRLDTLRTTSRTGTFTEDTPLEAVFDVLDDRTATMIEEPPQLGTEETDELHRLESMVWEHAKRLPPKTGDVFWLLYGREMKRADAAEWLKMPPKTVDWHHNDALQRLRTSLRAEQPEGTWDESRWFKVIEDLGRGLDERQQQRREAKVRRAAGALDAPSDKL